MEREKLLHKQAMILDKLCHLPRKMLQLHEQENMTEFVLHELCHEQCFNFNKAAYFVDNPDFNCCKGIAGFSQEEAYDNGVIWEKPHEFTKHMLTSDFNKKVRQWAHSSFKSGSHADEKIVDIIASDLHLSNPSYCSWNLKHGNHGILVYEKQDEDDIDTQQVANVFCVLGFCPVF